MSFSNETVNHFLDAQGRAHAAHDGGSAAAVMGSMGAALGIEEVIHGFVAE